MLLVKFSNLFCYKICRL